MAKIIIVGAGFAGHTAAMTLSEELRKRKSLRKHEITVISRQPKFTYIPSLIWVGIGEMKTDKIQFELAPVYKRLGIKFTVGKVYQVHPDEKYLWVETGKNEKIKFDYDYLIIATGPLLDFSATPGLGPDGGKTYSVCTTSHAEHTAVKYLELIKELENGREANVVVGTGHGKCTCQGAALEFIFNIHFNLQKRGLRKQVNLTWLSNEPKLGDMGVDGIEVEKGATIISSEVFMTGLFESYGIKAIIKSHVNKINEKTIGYETIEGDISEIPYDFAMLLPPFKGQKILYIDENGRDITEKVCNPDGFVKVDAVYGKKYEDLNGADWPKTYQSPVYQNIFAAGIAFATPGPMSKPGVSPNGTVIAPSSPRTGYTSELCGKAAALNIIDLIDGKKPSKSASLAETAGICVASMHNNILKGNAIIVGIFPFVRDREKYPEYGRDLSLSALDIGVSGSWIKLWLHYAFLYKLRAKPFWQLLP
jgi:sulfide:quinone oxidoreductase